MRRLAGWVANLDNPAVVAAIATIAAIAFVIARVGVMAHWDITRFIDVGTAFSNRRALPAGVTVSPGGGYDGQFYYRLALDPADLQRSAFGITLDNPYRLQRIAYSVTAWLAAGGQQRLIPDTLVAVNVLAFAALAWVSALLARDCGRRAIWGLLVVGYFGFLFSVGRDLTEVCEMFLVVAALVALRRGRAVLAGGLLAGAVLSRETALVVVVGIALVSLRSVIGRKRRLGRADMAWAFPAAAYVAWQLVIWSVAGSLPLRSDSEDNVTYPFLAMGNAVWHYFQQLPSQHAVIWFAEAVTVALIVGLAAASLRVSRASTEEKVSWTISLILVLSLTKVIWSSHADFRGFEDLYVLSIVILLDSNRRLGWIAALAGVIWMATFVHRVLLF